MKYVLLILLVLFTGCSSLSNWLQSNEEVDTEASIGISISSQNHEI